jgi:hypothetical protein
MLFGWKSGGQSGGGSLALCGLMWTYHGWNAAVSDAALLSTHRDMSFECDTLPVVLDGPEGIRHAPVGEPAFVCCLGVKDSGVTMVVNSFPAGAGGPL